MRTISCSVQPRLRLLLQRRLLAFSTYSPDNTLPETENQQPTITVNNNGRRSRFPDMHNKYPRIQYSKTTITYEKFLRQYESLKSSETKDTIAVTIHGISLTSIILRTTAHASRKGAVNPDSRRKACIHRLNSGRP